jgi:hypothetical protein
MCSISIEAICRRWRCRSRAARGRLQPVAKNDAIDRSRKRLASFKSDAASNPSGRGFGVPTRAGFFGMLGFGTRL